MGNVCTISSKKLIQDESEFPTNRTYRSPQVEEIYQAYLAAKKKIEKKFTERSYTILNILKKVDWVKEVKAAAAEGYSALRVTDDLTKQDIERFAKLIYSLFGNGIYLYKEQRYIFLYWDVNNYDKQIPIKRFVLPEIDLITL